MPPLPRVLTLLAAALVAPLPAGAAAQAPRPPAPATLEVAATEPGGAPVVGALVRVDGVDRGWTDGAGALRVGGLPAGAPLRLEVRLPGTRAHEAQVILPPGGDVLVQVELPAAPIMLEPVAVTSITTWHRRLDIRRFRERAGRGVAPFAVMRGQLAKQPGRKTSDWLADVPWLREWLNSRGQSAGSRRGPPTCSFAFWVDGVYDPHLGNTRGIGVLGDLDALYPPESLEGIEAYPVAQTPAQFSGGRSGCGVVLLWTRDAESELPLIRKLRRHAAESGQEEG